MAAATGYALTAPYTDYTTADLQQQPFRYRVRQKRARRQSRGGGPEGVEPKSRTPSGVTPNGAL